MKTRIRYLFNYLLYLTPIGYVLTVFSIMGGEHAPGIFLKFNNKSTEALVVKDNPTLKDRGNWAVMGGVMAVQSWQLMRNEIIANDFICYYVFASSFFSILLLLTAIMPTFPWNKRPFGFLLTPLEVLLIVSIIAVTGVSHFAEQGIMVIK